MNEESRAELFIRLLDEVARTRGRIASAFAASRAASGLSDLEMVVLNAVTGAASPPTVPQIGRSLGHARQVVQRAASALVAKELAEWMTNPDHKRAHRLVATAKGQALKQRADAQGLAAAEHLAAGLDTALLRQAVDALHHVRKRLEDHARAVSR
ncbi:MAG: MarR family transcriptional regulator [Sphingomonadaceae bacterium]|nr:MarR family transcriptional regulator [Sphingomonadaceae bacterium]